MKRASQIYGLILLAAGAALIGAGYKAGWDDLWLRPDQRGRLLMRENRPAEAAQAFRDPLWRGLAHFRAGSSRRPRRPSPPATRPKVPTTKATRW